MNNFINRNGFYQVLETFKQGECDASMLVSKFNELLSATGSMSDQDLSEVQNIITNAELPNELSEQLLDSITDKTRIFVPPPPVSSDKESIEIKSVDIGSIETNDNLEEPSDTHSSSLFNELVKWNEDDVNREIQSGQIIRDTYRLVSLIGKGGMGEVWKAIDLIQDAGDSSDKYVAIKFINHEIRNHPFALKALVREFARYKQLIHPNIIKAYELNRDKNDIYIVMEYLEGSSLKDFIKKHPAGLTLDEAKFIIGGICKALNYAHHEGIIHLDLKPGNIFYDPETKKAKVIDFGIARLAKQTDRDKTRFDPGSLGAISTAYASVEMLLEEDPDPRDDIYSLACIAYELISGKHVFNGTIATKAERDKIRPTPVKGLKKAEFQAILKGLNFDRNARTPTAQQFFQSLYLPQISAKRNRNRWLIIAPVLLLAVILTPFVINKGYHSWKKHQIIEAIAQNQSTGIQQFQALPINKQLDLLLDKKTLLSLAQFSISQATTESKPIQFLSSFKPDIQTLLFKNLDVREMLINYYIENINKSLSSDNFDQALAYSINIIEKYPDSKNLADQMEKILSWKSEHLNQLEKNYYQCIKDNSKTLLELMPCLQATHKFIGRLTPQHKILNDPELSERYQQEISSALISGNLSQVENLLADWRTLVPTETPEREQLKHLFKHQKHVFSISKQVMGSTTQQMQGMINKLIKLDIRTKSDVLKQSDVKQKLMDYFNQNITTSIEKQQYTSAFKQVETAYTLFSDIENQQQNLQQLNNKILKYKNEYIKGLAKNYQTILNSEKFDTKALQNLQHQIMSIDPQNSLVKYPGASSVFARQIELAINNEQFDLAQHYIETWPIFIPTDKQNKERLALSRKYQEQFNNYEQIMAFQKRIQEALQSDQLADINAVIDDLQMNLSEQQKQRVINLLHTELTAFYENLIQTAVEQDKFNLADKIITEALNLMPEEKSLQFRKTQIEKERSIRIEALINDYQQVLNTETGNGKQIFSNLITLRAIDSQYLENHLELYQELKKHLMNLAKNDQALDKLQDITAHWETFFNGKENSQKAKEIYRETKNLIALRCLYTARQLKQQDKQHSADEFLQYGLSLEPVISVQNALKKELNKTATPKATQE